MLANRTWLGCDPFLLAHADNLTEFDVNAMRNCHTYRPRHCAMTMLLFRTDDPRFCGIVELDEAGVVQGFHEKVANPPGDLANAAVYICEPEVAEHIASLRKPVVDFSTEVIPAFVGRILGVMIVGYHRDIGSMAALQAAEREYPRRSGASD